MCACGFAWTHHLSWFLREAFWSARSGSKARALRFPVTAGPTLLHSFSSIGPSSVERSGTGTASLVCVCLMGPMRCVSIAKVIVSQYESTSKQRRTKSLSRASLMFKRCVSLGVLAARSCLQSLRLQSHRMTVIRCGRRAADSCLGRGRSRAYSPSPNSNAMQYPVRQIGYCVSQRKPT